jgi:hypothetical protein
LVDRLTSCGFEVSIHPNRVRSDTGLLHAARA